MDYVAAAVAILALFGAYLWVDALRQRMAAAEVRLKTLEDSLPADKTPLAVEVKPLTAQQIAEKSVARRPHKTWTQVRTELELDQ